MRSLLLAAAVAGAILPAAAQSLIGTRAGLISYSEGVVYHNGQDLDPRMARSLHIEDNDSLGSGAGRVEVLLNPCVVLHLDENSALRMLSNRLTDTRVELLAGSAIVRADARIKDTRVTVLVNGLAAPLAHIGLYRFDAQPPGLKVLAGRVVVAWTGRQVTIGPGRRLVWSGVHGAEKFDPQQTDAFDEWSEWRAAELARASGLTDRERRERAENEAAADRARALQSNAPPTSLEYPSHPPAPISGPVGTALGRARVCTATGR